MTTRHALQIVSLAVIVGLGMKSRFFLMPFIDRRPGADVLNGFADRPWPLYPRFLEGVRAHTKPGDRIAIIAPVMDWDRGYSYAYYRASYFLTGREVLPLIYPPDEKLTQNFRNARYIASFGMQVRVPAAIVWKGEGGILLRPIWRDEPPAADGKRSNENGTPTAPPKGSQP